MAGEEGAGGSRSRRRMDLNLYLGLPPLPRPPGRLDVAVDCPLSLPGSGSFVPPPPRAAEVVPPRSAVEVVVVPPRSAVEVVVVPPRAVAEEVMVQQPAAAAYSPSNALSMPEQLDPMIFAWLDGHGGDGEDAVGVVEPVAPLGAPLYGVSESPPPMLHPPFTGLESDDVIGSWAERFAHPGRVLPATRRVEMVSMGDLRHSSGVAIEAMTPELRLQRLIQVSEQHRIVRPGPVANRNPGASSPETERLVQAIQRSHNALEELRMRKVDGGCKVRGTAAVKDGSCGCNSSFDCNICLETAKEPVVTPCGHLFCWPCLYQWLHGHSVHSECPVCKGEVLEINVTPIYGRGGSERDGPSDVPPRPRANRSESLRQLLQMPDPRGIASMVRRLIENQDVVRGQAAQGVGVEVTVLPPGRTPRGRGGRRQQRQDNNALPSVPAIQPQVDNVNPQSVNQVPLPSSNADNAAPVVATAPQQSSSMEQASTSSTMAVIVGERAQSRRSRASESTTPTPTPRRTRRRQQ